MNPRRDEKSDEQQTLLRWATESALEQYGLSAGTLELLREERVSSGIIRRQIYKVLAGDGSRYVLRGYRPAFSGTEALISSKEALWSQQHWLEALSGTQGPGLPEPLPDYRGSFVVSVWVSRLDDKGSERPRLFILQRFVSGIEKNLGDLDREEWSLIGESVGHLHEASRHYEPPKRFVRPRWEWGHVFGEELKLWKHGRRYYSEAEMEVFREASRIAWWELKALGRGRRVFGVIHRDLQPTNFLLGGDSVGIVDFDACGWGHYLYDLALPLFAVANRHGWHSEQSRQLGGAFVRGYESKAALPPGYSDYIDTFVMMRRVSRVSILLGKAISNEAKVRPDFLSESVDLLRDFVDTREAPGARSYLLQKTRSATRVLYASKLFGPRNALLLAPYSELQGLY